MQCGTHRPYCLASKGLHPEGVFVRQGTSSVPASDTAIRQMIEETDGDNCEEMRSLDQALTFEKVTAEFAKRGLPFGETQMKTLGMIDTDGLYSNLALLLSDQCPHIIKAAAFGGTDQRDYAVSASMLIGVSSSTACRIMKSMIGEDFLAAGGNGRSAKYRIVQRILK